MYHVNLNIDEKSTKSTKIDKHKKMTKIRPKIDKRMTKLTKVISKLNAKMSPNYLIIYFKIF